MTQESAATSSEMATSQAPSAPKPRKTRAAAAVDPDTTPVRVKLKRGTYVGLGCPDPEERTLNDSDAGHGYTHDHPARTKYRDIPTRFDEDTQSMVPSREEYLDGEIIQLFPIPEHESDAAETIRAKDKRFTFSRKEALKRAELMVKQGTAEHA